MLISSLIYTTHMNILRMKSIYLAALVLFSQCSLAQNDKGKIDFETYNPPSSLVVPQHVTGRAKFPFIDVHNHQNNMPTQNLGNLLSEMDKLNMQIMVNLSGRNGEYLASAVKNVRQTNAKRLIVFANISFSGIGEASWTENAVKQLEEDVKAGAQGLKIFKTLGLSVKDNKGNLVAADDSRMEAIWEKCGQMGIPVLIHTADPKQFWDEPNAQNERWLELLTQPGRNRSALEGFSWEDLIKQQHNLIKKHPRTNFIIAHFGWFANNLEYLGKLLDTYPNMNIEFGAVIAELGRQPRMAKKFFDKYQDRILFGKDSWVPSEYSTYFRVLETEDEYFPYHKKYHAYWKMYGIGLSDEVLKKVYYKNAIRLIPGIDRSQFPDH
jgi:predicted TIM-barrel fold metal-dependent hydrolase